MSGKVPLRGLMLPVGLLTLLSPVAAQEFVPPVAGVFTLDPAHARLWFSVSHLGFSNYTALFRDFDAELVFDPVAPGQMRLQASVDPASVETFYREGDFDFNAQLAGPDFLDAGQFPQIRFESTAISVTGENRADVTGDLTLHGVTRPVSMAVTYNGGYAGHPLDPGGARIGFSAEGSLMRSDFGIGFGIPLPGSQLGVGDEVSFRIEAEFINPDASGPQVGP